MYERQTEMVKIPKMLKEINSIIISNISFVVLLMFLIFKC